MAVAMALSVAIHLALFIVAGWMLSDQSLPSLSNSMLLVSLAPRKTDGDVADDKLVAPAAAGDSAEADGDSFSSRMSVRAPEVLAETRMVAAAEIGSRALHPSPLSGSPDGEAGAERQDPVIDAEFFTDTVAPGHTPSYDVTKNQPGDTVVIVKASKIQKPIRTLIGVSPAQEKMLNRKLRKWTENLHRMPQRASGLTWEHKGQEYLAKITRVPAENDMGIPRVVVEISTVEDGRRLSTEVHMKRLAFSNYGQFVNRWDPSVQIHNDEMDGRFHSNSEISLTYSHNVKPLFHGKVTTVSRRVNVTNRWGLTKRDQIFVGGLQTGVRPIRLPNRFLPFPGKGAMNEDQVQRFTEDTRLTFFADGSFAWQAVGSASARQLAVISPDTTYIVAERKARLYVKGTVNGRVLVYSPERIVIEDDLVYEQNPEVEPDADDYLGLVSDKYVDIAPPGVTGPGDLEINAAIYAKRRFAVREYRVRENALLYLYGSLSVGSLSATEPRYSTRIRFDRRLEEMRPPGFPMTDRYEVESWDAKWHLEPTG